ncbi:MAG: hypothetical protein KDA92_01635 [Planctomycetales bacterium]|nr:hypothetical protein [Planctomycetales bacterium]MCA9166646.1 hypothetical protein [Planctomycetales bacterium]
MKKLLGICALCAVAVFASNAQAADNDVFAAMGFGQMKSVSDSEGMAVRGKGAGDIGGFVPYVLSYNTESLFQTATAKNVGLAVKVNYSNSFITETASANKSEFLFLGPKLPSIKSFGSYGFGH